MAMSRLRDKVALITGGANGMGRLACERFVAEGAKVVIADLDRPSVEELATQLNDAAGDAVAVGVELDVREPDQVRAAVDAAVSNFGRLQVLYNNAGISPGDDDTPEATDPDTFDLTMAVNVRGVFLCCKYGIPALRDAGGGSIVNVASFVAHMGAATPQIAYTSSKGAVLAMTREIAAIHARENIRANALCPGPVLTPLLAKFLSDEEKRQRRLVHIPMGRFGEAAEMVNGAVFLASDESSFMTGQSLIIDGGITSTYTTPE
jgi:NAD(P)-dependent dehydrogenase (short-subunit alcohol dehydrogenase family)